MAIDASIPLQAGKGVPPIDPTENATRAYSLAGTMVDTEEKIRQRNEGKFDRDALQNYLTSGGDISTPEGSQKAIKELQGKVSPGLTEKLIAHGDQVSRNFLAIKEQTQKWDQLHLEDISKQDEQVAPMLEQLNDSYQKTLGAQGKAAADAEFEKNRAGVLGWMGEQKLGTNPRFAPEVTKNITGMSPDQLPYYISNLKYHKTLIDERLAQAKTNAVEGGKRTFYSDGKDEYMQNDRGVTMKNVNGTWENVDVLPANAKKIGTQSAADAGGVQLTSGAKKVAALNYGLTGQLPARLSGQMRTEIMNEADNVRQALGLSPGEWSTLQYDAKAKSKALGNLTNLEGQVDAFEKSLTSYTKRALENLDSISTSDIPWINKIVQNVEGHIEGLPPNLAKLQVNLRAVASEYNKLSSGAMGNTQPGEKSLLEIQEMFKKSDNPDTLRATLGEVLKDGQFRATGIRETKDNLRSQITSLVDKKSGKTDETKVSPSDQKARDTDRVGILQEEKKKLVDSLNALDTKAPDYADKKQRIQTDILAVNKELGSKDSAPASTAKKSGKEITLPNGKKITVQVD
jgi:hypothetical protein